MDALRVLCRAGSWLSTPVAHLRMLLGRRLRARAAGERTEARDVPAVCWHEIPQDSAVLTEPEVGAPETGLQGGEVWAPRSGETPGL